MMKRIFLCLAIAATVMVTAADSSHAGLGVGLHYLRNLGDIDSNPDVDLSKDSFGLLGAYQFPAGPLKLEAQVEYIFNYAGTDNSMWIPQGWALIGGLIYGGAGIGIGHIDGDWQSDPFYALRAGVRLGLIDVYGTYNFWSNDDIKNATGDDLDSITFAAVLRFGK